MNIGSLMPGPFKSIVPPNDRYWADPHVVYRHDTYYVFVEEFDYARGKGHIAVIPLNEHGRHAPSIQQVRPCTLEPLSRRRVDLRATAC